jgi:hypothetical protein
LDSIFFFSLFSKSFTAMTEAATASPVVQTQAGAAAQKDISVFD